MTETAPSSPVRDVQIPWSVNEVCKVLRSSKWRIVKLMDEGLIRSFRVGRTRLIPADEVKRIMSEGTNQ